MKIKIIITIPLLLIIFINSTFGQLEKFKEYQKQVFGNLDLNKIKTGILYDAGLIGDDLTYFNGKDTDSIADWNKWQQSYMQIYSAHLTDVIMPAFVSVTKESKKIVKEGIVPLGIIHFQYNSFKENALTDNLITFKNNKLYNNRFQKKSPYDLKTLFIVSSQKNNYFTENGNIAFIFPEQLYFTNYTEQIKEIEADFNDGFGFRKIFLDEIINIYYNIPGEKYINVKVNYGNKTFVSTSKITILNREYNSIKSGCLPGDYGSEPAPDNTIEMAGTTPNGGIVQGKLGIWYGCQPGKIIKPILFIEGYDPQDNKSLNGDDYKSSSTGCKHLYSIYDTEQHILDNLRNEGYDILILDFSTNNISIRSNASIVINTIKLINNIKESDEELIVGGRSSGGLLARYALAAMEENNIPHYTKLLITIDTEHKGANISLGFQHLVADFLNRDIVKARLPLLILYDIDKLQNDALDCVLAKQMLYYHHSVTDIVNNKANPSSLYDDFWFHLNNQNGGYPTKLKKVAISNSGRLGYGQGIQYSHPLTELQVPLNTTCKSWRMHAIAYALPDVGHSGKIFEANIQTRFALPIPCLFTPWISIYSEEIYVDNVLPYDNATGSNLGWHNFTLDNIIGDNIFNLINLIPGFYFETENECFVPISSSLDLDLDEIYNPNSHGGVYCSVGRNFIELPNMVRINDNTFLNLNPPEITPFDLFYIDDNNQRHITSNSDWNTLLENQIYPENIFLQNQSIQNDRVYYALNTIKAGNNVTNSIPFGNYNIESGTNILFKAGNSINLSTGFHVNAGSNFHAKTVNEIDCEKIENIFKSENLNSDYPEPNTNTAEYNNSILSIIKQSESPLTVYPNPTTGKFVIIFNGYQETKIAFEVYNSSGNIISKKINTGRTSEIDLSKQ